MTHGTPTGPVKPEVGSLWRDREGNTWRLVEYIDGGPWCRLLGVTRFDGVPWSGAIWHAEWMLDLVRKAVPVPACGGVSRSPGGCDCTERAA